MLLYENKTTLFTYKKKGDKTMIERLVQEFLSWCLAVVCLAGIISILIATNKIYLLLVDMVEMF